MADKTKAWKANDEFVEILLGMGIARNAAERVDLLLLPAPLYFRGKTKSALNKNICFV